MGRPVPREEVPRRQQISLLPPMSVMMSMKEKSLGLANF